MIFVYFDQNFSISQLGYKLDNEKYTSEHIYNVCLLLYVCSDRSCSVKSGLISTFDTLI